MCQGDIFLGSEKTLLAVSEGRDRTGLACHTCLPSNELKLAVISLENDSRLNPLPTSEKQPRKDKCKTAEPIGATMEDGD